jgi:hypothetical protein
VRGRSRAQRTGRGRSKRRSRTRGCRSSGSGRTTNSDEVSRRCLTRRRRRCGLPGQLGCIRGRRGAGRAGACQEAARVCALDRQHAPASAAAGPRWTLTVRCATVRVPRSADSGSGRGCWRRRWRPWRGCAVAVRTDESGDAGPCRGAAREALGCFVAMKRER